MSAAVLEGVGLSRRYGAVKALEGVNISLRAGEVHAILGDNGAGKSTLIKLLTGRTLPTQGELRMSGTFVCFAHPREARRAGIAVVYQDLALAPLMSVARNFVLGREPTTGWFRSLDLTRARSETQAALEALGVDIPDVDRLVGGLSGGQRQCVAIARALHFGAQVLVLDEPTSALGVEQTRLVLDATRRAAETGVAVALITHDLDEAWQIADRITLLNRGRSLGSFAKSDTSREAVHAVMAGHAHPGLKRPG
ncbi:MAG: ATP-binding cassette domain-containing protein [Myxococcota bacterium]